VAPSPAGPSWWCDVARRGCVRPTEGVYPAEHECWRHGEYTVCGVCYRSGKGVAHKEKLKLVSGRWQGALAKARAPAGAGAQACAPPAAAEPPVTAASAGANAQHSSAGSGGAAVHIEATLQRLQEPLGDARAAAWPTAGEGEDAAVTPFAGGQTSSQSSRVVSLSSTSDGVNAQLEAAVRRAIELAPQLAPSAEAFLARARHALSSAEPIGIAYREGV
jgi:hypothetical protein